MSDSLLVQDDGVKRLSGLKYVLGLVAALAVSSCNSTQRAAPTTTSQAIAQPPMSSSSTTSTTAPCHSGSVTETMDFGSFPSSLLCITVDSRVTITMGTGWPIPVSSNDAVVLVSSTHNSGRSTATYKANSIGVANLQATWEPPVGSAVTSVQWSQAVRVVPSG